jgi:hypothetical protein
MHRRLSEQDRGRLRYRSGLGRLEAGCSGESTDFRHGKLLAVTRARAEDRLLSALSNQSECRASVEGDEPGDLARSV